MADRRILTPEVLRQLLRYDAKTGKLYWRERGSEWFAGESSKSPAQRANGWNAKWAGKEAFTCQIYGTYHIGAVLGITVNAHRVAWSIAHGVHIEDLREIDHINGNKADNRLANLREVPHAENAKNAPLYKSNKSGVAGVRWEPSHKAWGATINYAGKQRRIGRFKQFEDAVQARKAAEVEHGYHANHGRAAKP